MNNWQVPVIQYSCPRLLYCRETITVEQVETRNKVVRNSVSVYCLAHGRSILIMQAWYKEDPCQSSILQSAVLHVLEVHLFFQSRFVACSLLILHTCIMVQSGQEKGSRRGAPS